jgi:hypothetical protein
MTGPVPGGKGGGLVPIAGPRYRSSAYPLLDLAKTAVIGHAMIAEKVREHAAKAAADREAARADASAESAAAAPGQRGG